MFLFLLLTGCEALSLPGGLGVEVDPKGPGAPTSCASRVWYADPDGDGVGTIDTTLEDWRVETCARPLGYVSPTGDCDDDDHRIHPRAPEICDGVDNDCDGDIDGEDADVLGDGPWYTDADGDGYGSDAHKQRGCERPSGTVAYGGDCDDSDPAYHPGAEEKCGDPTDYNCDGSADADDDDGDGWAACEDCDDSDDAVSPGEDEVCDGVDNDCDGEVDEASADDAGTWYADADGDGYGDETTSQTACTQPLGYTAEGGDCDDADYDARPGAIESCNELDDDCDDEVDEPLAYDAIDWYYDGDGDGDGVTERSIEACWAPVGFVATDDDCDDRDASAYPGGVESCDAVDNDCDGDVDEDSTDATTWYEDDDGDGYGDPEDTFVSCERPPGFVPIAADCDDQDAAAYPGGLEVCDEDDDDCDGDIDEAGAADASTWYADEDVDGFGDPAVSEVSCAAPDGYVDDSSDCDDTDDASYPGATEYCGGADEDCDGVVDEDGAADAGIWYRDADGDGYRDEDAFELACDQPVGFLAESVGVDCDDGDADAHPDTDEYCDGHDDDCDGDIDEVDALDVRLWFVDLDGDLYGDTEYVVVACDQPVGFVSNGADCNDGDVNAYPLADETCDDEDDDCDGVIDEGALDPSAWYADADGDGWGNPDGAQLACDPPTNHVADNTDCDDDDSDTRPDASEACDGGDDDCDSKIDEDTNDADLDGVCDALDVEVCDGLDNDGDGEVDESDATDAVLWYQDLDGDDYGNDETTQFSCYEPAGGLYVLVGGDCEDLDASVNPDQSEVCEYFTDEDCDGSVDESGALDASTGAIRSRLMPLQR